MVSPDTSTRMDESTAEHLEDRHRALFARPRLLAG